MRNIHKVVATLRYSPEQMAQVRSFFPEAAFMQVDRSDTDTLLKELKDADVALVSGDLDDRFLGDNQLKWIHCDHAGLARSAKPALFERGILLRGAAGRSSPVLAEHAIYFMLAACYHTRELLHAQDSHQWGVADQSAWRGLYGRTAGLVGMGNNGKMLAIRLRALGMRLISWDRTYQEGFEDLEQRLSSDPHALTELVSQSDFICLNLALTDQTYHLFDHALFAHVKPGAVLVNMARGALVDTAALMEALDQGILSCAGLDVFEQEPLPADHPLWDYKNVYITPHVTPQVPDRTGNCIAILKENVRRYRAGERLLNQVDPGDAYHAR